MDCDWVGLGAAALGLPGAGALAAAPGAGAVAAVEPAGAGGALVARADGYVDRAGAGDAAVDRDRAGTLIRQLAAGNSDRVAVGTVAGAPLRHDHYAPEAIEIGR